MTHVVITKAVRCYLTVFQIVACFVHLTGKLGSRGLFLPVLKAGRTDARALAV